MEDFTMGIAAGGKIEQTIHRDCNSPQNWDKDLTISIPVNIVNSTEFLRITGHAPAPSPVSAALYAEAGLPFFEMYEERSGISGTFGKVKSVNEIDQERSLASGADAFVQPTLVKLNGRGRRITHESRRKVRQNFDDPDGLLDLVSPLEPFSTLEDLETEVEELKLKHEK
jgi:hypothetical protein